MTDDGNLKAGRTGDKRQEVKKIRRPEDQKVGRSKEKKLRT